MTTTLVVGASGFLGGWVVRALQGSPNQLRILARPTSDLSALAGIEREVVYGDLLDPPSLRAALTGVDEVYHVAGWINFHPRFAAQARRINYEGSVNLFQAALEAGVRKVVYTASIFAIGSAPAPHAPATEESEFNATELLDIAYVGAKRDAELAARAFIAQGLPLVRLYPGLCLGPGDRALSSSKMIADWMRGYLPALPKGGGICFLDARDAAAAHVAAMQKGVVGRGYLAPGYNLTIPDLFRQLSPLARRAPPPLTVPLSLAVWSGRLLERFSTRPLFESATIRLMARYWWYNDHRARTELGISYRPLQETLADTIAWLRATAP